MIDTANYIVNEIAPLKLEDTLADARALFLSEHYSHFPVADGKKFCGVLARTDAEFFTAERKPLKSVKHLFRHISVSPDLGWFEVLQFFTHNHCNLIPVVDKNNEYLGYYELDDFLQLFESTPFLHEQGVVLTISKGIHDYSFSEITQIVEANEASLLGIFISKIEDDMVSIVLKLSMHDIDNTKLSFRRYGYNIVNEKTDDKYFDNLRERSDYLKKYLNL